MKRPLRTNEAIGVLLLIAVSGSGCALGLGKSLHQYSLLESSEAALGGKARKIEVDANQDVIIATSNTDFPDEAHDKLLAQCPKGRIINVTAKHSTELGFLGYQNRMRMSGLCIE